MHFLFAMPQQLPASIKLKDKEFKTEEISESAKKILADMLIADAELARCSASLRMIEIARKELGAMLEKELGLN